MIEGNQIEQNPENISQESPVTLVRTEVLIHRGMGENVSQLANRYGLSVNQMKMALIEMGALKGEAVHNTPGKLTEREQKLVNVCTEMEIEPVRATKFLEKLSLTYKTGRRTVTKENSKKYVII